MGLNDVDTGTSDAPAPAPAPAPTAARLSQSHTSSELGNKEEAMASTNENVGVASGQISGTEQHPSFQPDARFWAIMATLCVVGLLAAFENTVVAIALPIISEELSLGENYIWVTNIFFLTSAAVQPLFGQLANIFGRRWLTMAIVAVFVFGSGLCGGATNRATIIVGRAIQGVGSGGISMIIDVIVSDLVPLRERGNYIAIVLSVYFVGMCIGPLVGGVIVDRTTWRWVFYLNLPIGGVAMVMIFVFLQVKYDKEMSLLQRLKRIDYGGNLLLIGSTVSVLYALTYGGAKYEWSHWSIVLTLVSGLLGLVLFMGYETTSWATEPVVPPRLFATRTSAIVFAVTFLNSANLYWVLFFLPVYFQAVLLASPTRSGVYLIPVIVIAVPTAVVAVLLLARFGRYKPLHLLGFALSTLGLGLMTLLDEYSSTAEWVVISMVAGGGGGFVLNTLLPAAQAGLPESDQAATTAAWSFTRSFGSIWGVAIPAVIFNNRFNELAWRLTDPTLRNQMVHGRAYQYASSHFVKSFSSPIREALIKTYALALKRVWEVAIVIAGVAFLLTMFEKEIKLRTELETEYGMEERKKRESHV
ncbi:MFS-type transporter TwmF [Exophiala dermatitidis]